MKEEIENLKKVTEILVTKMDAGLGLAQREGHCNNSPDNFRDKGDGPNLRPHKGKSKVLMGRKRSTQPKMH